MRTMLFIGIDDWDRPVYKCIETDVLWKDINLGKGKPCLHSCQNSFDGEPDCPIKGEFDDIRFHELYIDDAYMFDYQLLDRLTSDCEYYLGMGNRNVKHLYYDNEQKHIDAMKTLYNNFSDDVKPDWLTYEQILQYEKLMVVGK